MATDNKQVILIVEDEEAHAELISGCIHSFFSVATVMVADGEQALNYLLRKGAYAEDASVRTPDLILLDLRLPRVDGLEVLRRVREADDLKRVPVVVLTSSSAPGDIEAAYEAGANSYLTKKLDYEMLSNMVEDLGKYWLHWNRLPACPAV